MHKNNSNTYLENLFQLNFIKIEAYTKPNNVKSLRFKLEVFTWRQWRHVGYVLKSSMTFRGIFFSLQWYVYSL